MTDQTLQKLIELVQSTSPIIWQALIRRVYVVVISDLIWGAILLISAYYAFRFVKSQWDNWENDEGLRIGGALLFSVLGISGALLITSGLMWLGSPEYAAISFLLNTIK